MDEKLKTDAYKTINELKSLVSGYGYLTEEIIEKQYNFEFTVRDDAETVKVFTYFGKKGVKTILQGNQNHYLYPKISSIIFKQQKIEFETKQEKLLYNYNEYIGTDESGKGDIFGPLVVAGFHYDDSLLDDFARMGIKDSKELSDEKINSIALELLKNYNDRIESKVLVPLDYNSSYILFGNLNKLLADIHSEIIEKLHMRTNCQKIIIDKFAKEYRFGKLFTNKKLNVTLIEKGEQYPGVAAASIIARYYFVDWFAKTNFKGKPLPKGSSLQAITIAKKMQNEISIGELSKYAKLHFKTFRR
jgi:ribonuclease HIII